MRKMLLLPLVAIFLLACSESLVNTGNSSGLLSDPDDPTGQGHATVSLVTPPERIGFDDFTRAIPIPEVTGDLASIFNSQAMGDYLDDYTQPDMDDTLDGYVTDNHAFWDQVLEPAVGPYVDSLRSLQAYQAVNALILFIYESYQDFIGLSFYRWGGDITDRDQPQLLGHTRSDKRYGMDCSGFGASAFEAAVMLGILDSTLNESAFSWFGFRHICLTDPTVSDGGGRNGTTNNFRMEVSDMYKVGRQVTIIPAGMAPTDDQMSLMQAGDVVLKSGHMGILVEINDDLYFLESGGSTVNEDGLYTPYLAQDALEDFASRSTTTIKRCLPDKETSTGIKH